MHPLGVAVRGIQAVHRRHAALLGLLDAQVHRDRAGARQLGGLHGHRGDPRAQLEVCADLLAHLVEGPHLVGGQADLLAQLLLMMTQDLILLAQFLDQLAVDGAQAAVGQRPLDAALHVVQLEWLDDVVVGPLADRVDGHRGRGLARDEDDHRLLVRLPGEAHHVEARESRHVEIREHGVGTVDGDARHRGFTVRRHLDLVAERGQELLEQLGHGGLVVDDEQARRRPATHRGRGAGKRMVLVGPGRSGLSGHGWTPSRPPGGGRT